MTARDAVKARDDAKRRKPKPVPVEEPPKKRKTYDTVYDALDEMRETFEEPRGDE
jgi:hypothetical protein